MSADLSTTPVLTESAKKLEEKWRDNDDGSVGTGFNADTDAVRTELEGGAE